MKQQSILDLLTGDWSADDNHTYYIRGEENDGETQQRVYWYGEPNEAGSGAKNVFAGVINTVDGITGTWANLLESGDGSYGGLNIKIDTSNGVELHLESANGNYLNPELKVKPGSFSATKMIKHLK